MPDLPEQFILRESTLARGVFWATSVWALMFGVACGWFGDKVTSRQWQYLMTIPGGKWLWFSVFAGAAAVAILGLVTRRHAATAIGLCLSGGGSLLIAGFYTLAPIFDRGLLTLGAFPWALCAGVSFVCAAMEGRPVRWY